MSAESDLQYALKNGRAQDLSYFPNDVRLFYLEKLRESPIIFPPGPPRASVYNGTWHLQDRGQCVPWSIVHGAKVTGAEYLHSDFLKFGAALFRITTAKKDNNQGMYFREVIETHQNHPNSGLQIVWDPDIKSTFDGSKSVYYTSKDRPEFVTIRQQNAQTIVSAIKAGHSYMLSVENARLNANPRDKDTYHAICLGGYRISENGRMRVQIIDSHCGVYWTSLSHLSWSLTTEQTHVRMEKAPK